MKKISKEDAEKLEKFQDEYTDLMMEVSRVYISKMKLELEELNVQERTKFLILREQELNAEFTEKYGESFFELETEQ